LADRGGLSSAKAVTTIDMTPIAAAGVDAILSVHARDQAKLSVPAILLGKARRIVNVALVPELMAGFVAAVKPSRCTFDAMQSLADRKH
jgi:hypothetical protein